MSRYDLLLFLTVAVSFSSDESTVKEDGCFSPWRSLKSLFSPLSSQDWTPATDP